MHDGYNLQRFLDAQKSVYEQVCEELRAGQKRSHWMWFIFPQIQGLGQSSMAIRFAISSLDEAKAYLQHSVLGTRLRECSGLVAAIEGRSIDDIFGYPDDLKLHSSMTLFARTSTEDPVFQEVLQKYFHGEPDHQTLKLLRI